MKNYRFLLIFGSIGVLCVLIDYVIYTFLNELTGLIFWPKILSSIISVSVNYLLNSRFNFNNKQKISVKFYFSYILLYTFLILLNAAFNVVFIHLTGKVKLSFWLAACIAAACNYLAVKLYFATINKKQKQRL